MNKDVGCWPLATVDAVQLDIGLWGQRRFAAERQTDARNPKQTFEDLLSQALLPLSRTRVA